MNGTVRRLSGPVRPEERRRRKSALSPVPGARNAGCTALSRTTNHGNRRNTHEGIAHLAGRVARGRAHGAGLRRLAGGRHPERQAHRPPQGRPGGLRRGSGDHRRGRPGRLRRHPGAEHDRDHHRSPHPGQRHRHAGGRRGDPGRHLLPAPLRDHRRLRERGRDHLRLVPDLRRAARGRGRGRRAAHAELRHLRPEGGPPGRRHGPRGRRDAGRGLRRLAELRPRRRRIGRVGHAPRGEGQRRGEHRHARRDAGPRHRRRFCRPRPPWRASRPC